MSVTASTHPRDEGRPVLVVIDTNVWVQSHLLADPVSASLVYAIQSTSEARLGLLQVIEMEVEKHGLRMGEEARTLAEKSHAALRSLVGVFPEVVLPDDEALASMVRRRVEHIGSIIHRVPFTHDIAVRALQRVVNEQAPSMPSSNSKIARSGNIVSTWRPISTYILSAWIKLSMMLANTRKDFTPIFEVN